jgi:plasmid stabilization system protein ParE
MAKEVNWSDEAIITFNAILDYIETEWTGKETEAFIGKTDKVIKQISGYPYMFKKYNKHNIHQALIAKQTLLLYKIYTTHIDLITFWDTRQNPMEKKLP